jgi:phenylacetate-CoA ligase
VLIDVNELILLASEKSPYYKGLYSELSKDKLTLDNLPIVNQEDFWKANDYKNNKLLTAPIEDGVVFKSGGTTGKPKFSVYTKEEWQLFTTLFGEGMDQRCIKRGDRVGNLFYSGDLYASFLFITKSLENAKTKITQFPMTGGMKLEDMVKTVEEYGINVLAGVPTSFIAMADLLIKKGKTLDLDRVLYGGESLFPEQEKILKSVFPKAEFMSVGYASVDGGHLGYIDEDCGPSEHKVFPGTVMEILDDYGKPITKEGEVGKLTYTNLCRTLMPIIRYPVGDMGCWVSEGRFKLLGRSDEGARIGPVTVSRDDLVEVFRASDLFDKISNFQMLIINSEGKDKLIVHYTSVYELNSLRDHFYRERPMYLEAVKKNHIRDVDFLKVEESELVHNERTGKLKLVIDQRIQG